MVLHSYEKNWCTAVVCNEVCKHLIHYLFVATVVQTYSVDSSYGNPQPWVGVARSMVGGVEECIDDEYKGTHDRLIQ